MPRASHNAPLKIAIPPIVLSSSAVGEQGRTGICGSRPSWLDCRPRGIFGNWAKTIPFRPSRGSLR
jgi:hypothetical protein